MWNIVEVADNIPPRIVGDTVELPKDRVALWYMNDHILFCTSNRVLYMNPIFFAYPGPREVSVFDVSDNDKMEIRQRLNKYLATTEGQQMCLDELIRKIPYKDDRYYTLEALCASDQ